MLEDSIIKAKLPDRLIGGRLAKVIKFKSIVKVNARVMSLKEVVFTTAKVMGWVTGGVM